MSPEVAVDTVNESKPLDARKRAAQLARSLVAASKQFDKLAELPPGSERDGLLHSIELLSATALPWLSAMSRTRRKRRPRPDLMSGWVGCE